MTKNSKMKEIKNLKTGLQNIKRLLSRKMEDIWNALFSLLDFIL